MKFGSHKENVTAEICFSPLNKFVSHEEFDVARRYFVANISSFITFSYMNSSKFSFISLLKKIKVILGKHGFVCLRV